MKKILSSLVICAVSLSACTSEANSYKTLKFGAQGYPHEGSVFEIATQIGTTRYAYWCGGAEYARRHLGAGWTTRFYVARGMGPGEVSGRRSTVLFTLDPPVAQGQTGVVKQTNAFKVGDSMSVQGGDGQCDPFLLGLG